MTAERGAEKWDELRTNQKAEFYESSAVGVQTSDDLALAFEKLNTYSSFICQQFEMEYIKEIVGADVYDNAKAIWRKQIESGAVPGVSIREGNYHVYRPTDILLNDAKEIALRVGVKRVRKELTDRLREFWTRRGHANDDQVTTFLSSDTGQQILSYVFGFTYNMVQDNLPEGPTREFGDLVARECRVQGGAELADDILNLVMNPVLEVAQQTGLRVNPEPVEQEMEILSLGSSGSLSLGA